MLWKRGSVLGLQVCGLGLGGCGLVNITANPNLKSLTQSTKNSYNTVTVTAGTEAYKTITADTYD